MFYETLLDPVLPGEASGVSVYFLIIIVSLLLLSFLINLFADIKIKSWRPARQLNVLDLIIFLLVISGSLGMSYLTFYLLNKYGGVSFFAQAVIGTLVFQIVLGSATFFCLKYRGAAGHFISVRGKITELIRGLYIYIKFYPLLLLVFVANLLLIILLGLKETEPAAVLFLLMADTSLRILVICLLVIVAAPLVEELAFRGYFYPALRSQKNIFISTLTCATVFALFHFEPQFFLVYFFLGWLLCKSYEESGSLFAPFALHAFHNLVTLLYFYVLI
ncbi:MAG: CPBP family intramembrane glutamic endopeptidase [bacterium]